MVEDAAAADDKGGVPMEKLMASSLYGLSRGMFSGVAAYLGIQSARKDTEIAGLSPVVWMLLSLLSAMGVALHMLTKIFQKLEDMEKDQ